MLKIKTLTYLFWKKEVFDREPMTSRESKRKGNSISSFFVKTKKITKIVFNLKSLLSFFHIQHKDQCFCFFLISKATKEQKLRNLLQYSLASLSLNDQLNQKCLIFLREKIVELRMAEWNAARRNFRGHSSRSLLSTFADVKQNRNIPSSSYIVL